MSRGSGTWSAAMSSPFCLISSFRLVYIICSGHSGRTAPSMATARGVQLRTPTDTEAMRWGSGHGGGMMIIMSTIARS